MDAVLFGAGYDCRMMLSFLEKQCHILYITDNNEALWGSSLEGYEVLPVNNIVQEDFSIIITSRRYSLEITNQLLTMGVDENRIYSCHEFCTGEKAEREVFPLNAEKLVCRQIPLYQYDLLQEDKSENEKEGFHKRILIICKAVSVYTRQLIENMASRYPEIEFSLLTNGEGYEKLIHTPHLMHIYRYQSQTDIRTILEQLPIYDAIQVLWIDREWSYFYRLIRKKAVRLNLNIGGSDFYRSGQTERDFKRRLIASADCIIGQTEGMVRGFSEYYGQDAEGKMCLLPYGVEVLDWINSVKKISKEKLRTKYGIVQDRIIVTCGHNAGRAHQHIELLDALKRLPKHIKERIICVFPMTYPKGAELYIDEIRSLLETSDLEHLILTEFMDFQKMAEYARISDIMIHVQTTDQLSSTMLEEMYAGSVIIAGSWLPYESLHELGLYFLDADKISDVTDILEDVVMNIREYKQKCKENSKIVWNHSSWERLAPKWYGLWE